MRGFLESRVQMSPAGCEIRIKAFPFQSPLRLDRRLISCFIMDLDLENIGRLCRKSVVEHISGFLEVRVGQEMIYYISFAHRGCCVLGRGLNYTRDLGAYNMSCYESFGTAVQT